MLSVQPLTRLRISSSQHSGLHSNLAFMLLLCNCPLAFLSSLQGLGESLFESRDPANLSWVVKWMNEGRKEGLHRYLEPAPSGAEVQNLVTTKQTLVNGLGDGPKKKPRVVASCWSLDLGYRWIPFKDHSVKGKEYRSFLNHDGLRTWGREIL